MLSVRLAVLCALGLLVATACTWRGGTGAVGAATPAVASEATAARRIVAVDGAKDGIRVTVDLPRDTVEPGHSLDLTVTVRNERSEPAIVGFGTCGVGATVYGDVPVPWEPAGREWDGIEGDFKRFALEQGLQPGAVDARLPVRVDAVTTPCPDMLGGPTDGITLAAGEARSGTLTWTAQVAPGIPAQPGGIRLHAELAYDPPPLPTPNCELVCSSTIVMWHGFAADGSIRVAGDTPPILSAGEAIDRLLGESEFTGWLRQMKSSTWSNLNVFLSSSDVDGPVVPRGPSWEIDLFREMGVPRNFALAFVDPFTGEVKHVDYCNEPCDR